MDERFFTVGKKLLVVVFIIIGTILGLFLAYKLIFYLAPFIIAFILSSVMEPFIRFMTKKTCLKRKSASLIALLLTISTIGLVITLIILKLIIELKSLYNMLPQYYAAIYNNVNLWIDKAAQFYFWLPEEITANLGNILSNISTIAVDMLNSVLKSALVTAISIPQIIIFILVTILSTYFLASDRENIYSSIRSSIPDSWFSKMRKIKNDMFSALFGYIRAQLIIMTVTFTELSISFTIIGIKQPILLALIISLVDALPILGTGGILVPWSIYAFIIGDIRIGLSILITYLIVLVVRQMIEPKVLGQQIGMHPLITLMSMYAGLKLIGVGGIIAGPVSVLLISSILKGVFKGNPLKSIMDD